MDRKCSICRQPEYRHTEIVGMGRVCPASGFTFRAEAPDPRVAVLREALERILKPHDVAPPGQMHIYGSNCDACHHADIARAALAATETQDG